MNKPDLKSLLNTAKSISSETTDKVIDAAGNIVNKTQGVIASTTEKIKDGINNQKKAVTQTREEEVAAAMDIIKKTAGEETLQALGDSPVKLTESKIKQIKSIFPIPQEQCILWADAEFDLRPSGIICTEKGVFIRSNINVLNIKFLPQKAESQEESKSILFYYHWEDFEPEWFISDNELENKALSVEPQCQTRFVSACRTLSSTKSESVTHEIEQIYDTDLSYDELISKVAPIMGASVESSEAAIFTEQKAAINTPAGHGELAEEAITRLDRLTFHDARIVGRDNAKDGADRLVDGVFIQTKYYNSARGSLEASFNPQTGNYRYINADGSVMQLEVPKDQYQRVLEGFRKKIADGKVPGVTDPNEAVNIVRRGRLTYKQAVNLTKPGTIESLCYDALTGAVICSCAFGLTFAVTVFLTWRKTGDLQQAIKAGTKAGIQVFGISFLQHVLVSQLARTSIANSLIAPSQYIVGKLGTHASAVIVNGLRALSGKGAIYGAAASKQFAKILRSNMLTSVITFAVFSIPETYNLASQKISVAQYTKNMSVLAGSIAGGAGGAMVAGIAAAKIAGVAGTAVTPGIGTAVGIVGGFIGGTVGAKAVDIVGDIIHEDDTERLGRLFNAIVSCMISEYMLDNTEIDSLVASLNNISQKEFKMLFETIEQSERQEEIIQNFLEPHFDAIMQERERFSLPSNEELAAAFAELFENE